MCRPQREVIGVSFSISFVGDDSAATTAAVAAGVAAE